MLHKGMAVIIRDKDELEAFAQAADKKGYFFGLSDVRCINSFPVRISCNADRPDYRCLSSCHDLDYPLRPTINKVVEASDLFKNQLISLRKVKS